MLLRLPKNVFLLYVLLVSCTAVGQPSPENARDLYINTAKILPDLYQKKAFDSIGLFLSMREQVSPRDVDIFCLKMLLAIETGTFTREHLFFSELYYDVKKAARIINNIRNGNGCDAYYSGKHFDGCTYAYPIFSLINNWADQLINTRPLDSTELFLCNVFTGKLQHPTQAIRDEPANYTFLDPIFAKAYRLHRDGKLTAFAGLSIGAWIPYGPLAIVDAHPGAYVFFGAKTKRDEWSIITGGMFVDAPHAYSILVHDTMHLGHHFDGWIFGLDYSHYFLHTAHFESGLLLGIGYTGMDIGYTPKGSTKATYQQPVSFYQSLGVRMNYFYDRYNPHRYIGLTAKYTFLNYYGEISGINLTGHAITIDITHGWRD